jgi:hypothetical protein
MIDFKIFIKNSNAPVNSLSNLGSEFTFWENTEEYSSSFDKDYIEGALVIELYGSEIIGLDYYDLIDQLLVYYIEALNNLRLKGTAEFSFPDQPLKVSIKDLRNGKVELRVGEKSINADKREFTDKLLRTSKVFFEHLENNFELNYDFILNKINTEISYWQ